MDKNFIIAILLSTLVVIVFSSPQYQKHFGREITKQTAPAEQVATNTQTPQNKPVLSKKEPLTANAVTAKTAVTSEQETVSDSLSATTPVQIDIPSNTTDTIIENKDLSIAVAPRGGVISNVTLTQFAGPEKNQHVELIVPGEAWYDGTIVDGELTLQLTDLVFAVEQSTSSSVTLKAMLSDGKVITRTYSLEPEGYMLSASTVTSGSWNDPTLSLAFNGPINNTEIPYRQIKIWPFTMFMRDDRLDYQKMVFLGDGMRTSIVNGDEKTKNGGKRIFPKEDHSQKIDAKKAGEGTDTFNGALDWYAVRNKYFISIAIPSEKERWAASSYYNHTGTTKWFQYTLSKKQSDGVTDLEMYLGPISYFTLKTYGRDLTEAMELSFRFVRPLSIAFLWVFRKLSTVFSNWGIIIVVFSLLIKLVLYPLTKTSFTSMQKMSNLQPQISQLKEKYKNNPQMLQKATMELYKKEGVNPFSGCLPGLLQMPVFFALYPVVGRAFELRQAMFIPHWIDDLSRPDPFYILPIAMGLSMYFQQKATMKDPSQKAMLYMMPVMMVMFFLNLSAGLSLYFFLFNILSHLQQSIHRT